jgi:Barrier to autointegration factor
MQHDNKNKQIGIGYQVFDPTQNINLPILKTGMSIVSESKKCASFCNEPLNEKLVTEIPGIGLAAKVKMSNVGLNYAYQLVGMYLYFKQNFVEFKKYLKNFISQENHLNAAFNAITTWYSDFDTIDKKTIVSMYSELKLDVNESQYFTNQNFIYVYELLGQFLIMGRNVKLFNEFISGFCSHNEIYSYLEPHVLKYV